MGLFESYGGHFHETRRKSAMTLRMDALKLGWSVAADCADDGSESPQHLLDFVGRHLMFTRWLRDMRRARTRASVLEWKASWVRPPVGLARQKSNFGVVNVRFRGFCCTMPY